MNILFLSQKSPYSESSYGGAESSMRLLAQGLSDRGHAVHYLSNANSTSLVPRRTRHTVDGVNVVALYPILKGRPRRFVKWLNHHWLKLTLRTIIKKNRIQLIYCYYERPILAAVLSVRQALPQIKIVMRMAGLHWYESCVRDGNFIPIYLRAFQQVDAVNFIHDGLESLVRARFSELGVASVDFADSFVGDIGTGVDAQERTATGATVSASVPIGVGNQFRVAMASRFSKSQKRQDILIKAVSLLDEFEALHVHLIGSGENLPVLRSLCEDLGIEKQVSFHDFMPQQQLWEFLKSCDLICHACDYEGLGKIIVESMGLGLPILVSDVPVLNQYIVDGVNGFIVENTPEAWSDRISELLQDSAKRALAASGAYQYVAQNLRSKDNIQLFEREFMRVIEKPS